MLAQYYQDAYLFIITLFTVFCYTRYKVKVNEIYDGGYQENTVSEKEVIGFVLMLFMVLFVGSRPISGRYFGDMANYYYVYRTLEGKSFAFDLSLNDLSSG